MIRAHAGWHGTRLLYVAMTVLMAVIASPAVAEESSAPSSFAHLFNGKDLTGWVPVNTEPDTWSVVGGELHCTGIPRLYLPGVGGL